jgi:hypothetical protein
MQTWPLSEPDGVDGVLGEKPSETAIVPDHEEVAPLASRACAMTEYEPAAGQECITRTVSPEQTSELQSDVSPPPQANLIERLS